MKTIVTIKATQVINNHNGTFQIEFETKPLTTEQIQCVEQLLPNLAGEFYKLLSKETLIQSLATESEINKFPSSVQTTTKNKS